MAQGAARVKTRSSKRATRPPGRAGFPIAGIGASAGGLEALEQLLGALPPKPGIALVLVQHLDPRHRSLLAEILSKTARMPVHEAVDRQRVEANCIYTIPPNADLALQKGKLCLSPRPKTSAAHLPIDFFLQSLAADQKTKAIGVILSGNGSDGTAGLTAIKAEGGITFAQDEASAKFDGMPHSAIASGNVDFVLRPDAIAAELLEVTRRRSRLEKGGAPVEAANGEYNKIFIELRKLVGVDFSQYKLPTIERRVHRRMALLKIEKLADYARHLREHPDETEKLYRDLLINVTRFFRDPEAYDALRDEALPRILRNRSLNAAVRIWTPGCATGEETYSIAIAMVEAMEKAGKNVPLQIFGTDISEISLEKARKGIYPESIADDVSAERLRRFFVRNEGAYQIGGRIREACVFARHNLLNDPPFSRMDLVSCRNLLIYLGPALQKKAGQILHYALQPNAFLFLGSSEGLSSLDHLFEPVDKKYRIFAQKPAAGHYLNLPPRAPFTGPSASTDAGAGAQTAESESAMQAEADRIVLANYSPAGVIVNDNLNVVHFRGRTSRYLEPAQGKATLNLLRMAKPGLGAVLQTAINGVRKSGRPVKRKHIPLQFDGEAGFVTIEVFPILQAAEGRCFLTTFQEERAPARVGAESGAAPGGKLSSRIAESREIARLRAELARSEESLRTEMEIHEASDEELRSANEEVLSANEELQSSNEELESSKEELQSANEEMSTLNDELRNRNHDLSQSNSDLVNLLGSINIPVVMLGPDLRIRRLTPSSTKVFNILASDVGRPITDIRAKIDAPDLEPLILEVLKSLTPVVREVQDAEGRWHSLEIHPYRTTDNKIDGAVLSLVDIDLQKRAAELESKTREFSDAILQTLRQPFLILDAGLRVVRGNEAFYRTFQVKPKETERELLFQLGNGQWDIPELRKLLEELHPRSQEVEDFQVEHDFEGIGHRIMLLNARHVNQFGGKSESLILLAIDDVTERALAERQSRAHAEELDRSNRAMVGRELRMIELKQEVNEALRQQGKAARYALEFEARGEDDVEKEPEPHRPEGSS